MDYKKIIGDIRLWLAAAAVIILGIVGYYMLSSGVIIEASDKTGEGIAPNSTFTIKMTKPTTLEEMYQKTSIEPKQGFFLTRVDETTFTLKPYRAFEPKANIKVKVANKNVSFKVRNAVVVTAVFPGEGGEDVPIRTGIEMTFNTKDISLEAFKAAIEISPSVATEVNGTEGKFVVYPIDGMEYETAYTVTLKAGFTSQGGAKLENDFQLRFKTQSEFDEKNSYRFVVSDELVVNSLSADKPVMRVYLDEEIATQPLAVEIFKFADASAFKTEIVKNYENSAYKYSSTKIDTEGLEKVSEFNGATFPTANSNSVYNDGRRILQFPEALEEGFYAVKLTVKYGNREMTRYNFIQVSDLSVFYMRQDDDMLVWINDASTGLPASGATFQMEGSHYASLTTDAEGKAITNALNVVTDSEYNVASVFTVKYGDRTFIDTRRLYTNMLSEDQQLAKKYMAYVFTDRPIYKSTDTVRVWGAVRPRLEGTAPLEKVTLAVVNAEQTQEVKLNPDGTFTVDIDLKNIKVPYQWSGIYIYVPYTEKDGNIATLASTYMQVQDYVKPTYTAETKTEKPVYMMTEGDKAKVTIDVSTYDGTPVPDMKMNLQSYYGDDLYFPTSNLVTDENGNITVDMTVRDTKETSWYPRSYTYRFENADSEGENFYKTGDVNVLHHDIMIQGETTVGKDSISVDVTTNKIDISKIKTQDDLWEIENLRGAPLSVNVTAELHKVYYTKVENGTYYDYISRKSEKYYNYVRHDDTVKNFNFTTEAGKYKLTDLPLSDENAYYYLVLTTKDSKGKNTTTQVYTGAEYYRNNQMSGITNYNLNKRVDMTKENPNNMAAGDNTFADLNELRYKFTDNENVTFYLEGNDEEVKNMKGVVLYTIVQDDFTHTGITTTGEVTIPFIEALVPNYTITGAYFDGKYIFALGDKYMRFDPKNREINIKLDTNKKIYAPSETIEITATITEKATGNVIPNTDVVLSMVDEAIFALSEQNINILDDLYAPVHSSWIEKYTSYMKDSFSGAGEKGGGGGDEPSRTDFKDTAHFEVVKTNENGLAKFTFKLPDNITSWRMTTLALSPKNYAGSYKTNTIVTKDYFVMPIINEQLIEGDALTVGLRGAGVGVSAADISSYTVTVEGNGVTQKKEATGKLREYKGVSFTGLKKGNYTVTITGKSKTFSDTVELPVQIIETGIEVEMMKTVNLKDGIKDINPIKFPVRMNVYDQSQMVYNTVLSDLSWSGQRADQRIARAFVQRELEKTGNTLYYGDDEADKLSDIYNQVIKLFPYANASPELTIKAILAAPEIIGTDGMYNIDQYMMSNYPDATYTIGTEYISYVAQALREETPTGDLPKIIKSDESDYVDKMYIAIAMQLSGDTKNAEDAYTSLVTKNLKELQGNSHKIYYIDKQGERNAQDCTAAALMLATLLEKPEKEGLVMGLVKKPSAYEPYLMEKLFFANKYTASPSKSKFSYLKDGKTITENLEGANKYIIFNEAEFAKAGVKTVSGDVFADVYYTGKPSDQTNKEKELIGVTKTITPVNSNTIKRGDLVKVTITVDLTKLDKDVEFGYFVLDEYIPSGMRFENYLSKQWGKGWYFENRQGQRLEFTVYRDSYNEPIIYYARCATEGEYVVENTYVSSRNSDVWGAGGEGRITINE